MSKIQTDLIHAGEEHNTTRAIVAPIFQSATYHAADSLTEQSLDASAAKASYFYHRHGNPTNSQLSNVLAKLEHTEDALLQATGMAAISTAVLATVQAGDHVVVQQAHYAASQLFFRDFLPAYGIEVTQVDQTCNEDFAAAIQENTKLIYLETPSNPELEITDLQYVSSLARANHIFTIVDNTFASPINQCPIDFGIDAVVHSATKYLGGHSDLTAGAICGSKEFIERAWKRSLALGASLSPMDGWLLLRGIKTLSLRVHQINTNAMALAEWLLHHNSVQNVIYAGLPSHPQHELAAKQMSGFTGMLCFEVKSETPEEGFTRAQTVLKHVGIFSNAVSLGGVESLITHPASLWGSPKTDSGNPGPEQKSVRGYRTGLLRVSVGIEHIDDLKADLEQALASLK